MAGGIQPGTTAATPESLLLDGDVNEVAKLLSRHLLNESLSHLYYEEGHDHKRPKSLLPEITDLGVTVGCVPDGGMWFSGPRGSQRTLLAVFEAKHQQDAGNAIERWGKNYLICKALNPNVIYVTFMTGAGAVPGGTLHKFGTSMAAINGDTCRFHYAPEGFSRTEILRIMTDTLGLDLSSFPVQL